MFRWKKLGKIFDPRDVGGRPWLQEFAQAPATLILENSVRVYFSCRPLRDGNGQYVSYTGYVELDKSDLTRVLVVAQQPIMQLGELGTFDQFGTYPVSVIHDGNRILAYYGGWTRCESTPYAVAIGIAASSDGGRTFERLGPGPLLAQTPNEPFVLSGPKIRRFDERWYLWYVAGVRWVMHEGRAESIYKIRMASSVDGILWHRNGRDIINSRLEANECQASPDVIHASGRFHMFFCYKYGVDFRNSARGYRIGYAFSDDLFEWTRDDLRAGIDISEQGWDSESIAYPHVFQVDGRTFMLYLGNEVGREGFGLAELDGEL